MRPLDFYDLGVQLAASARTEAEYRATIGRLYYGLHHEACCRYFREFQNALPLARGSRHVQLIQRYRALRGNRAAQRVQSLLGQLSGMRNVSDYELDSAMQYRGRTYHPDDLMTAAISVAASLLVALESFSPGAAADGCVCRVMR